VSRTHFLVSLSQHSLIWHQIWGGHQYKTQKRGVTETDRCERGGIEGGGHADENLLQMCCCLCVLATSEDPDLKAWKRDMGFQLSRLRVLPH